VGTAYTVAAHSPALAVCTHVAVVVHSVSMCALCVCVLGSKVLNHLYTHNTLERERDYTLYRSAHPSRNSACVTLYEQHFGCACCIVNTHGLHLFTTYYACYTLHTTEICFAADARMLVV
jgi:hypothetical protein